MTGQNKEKAVGSPSPEELGAQAGALLWNELLHHAMEVYQAAIRVEYSRCSMMPGWNVKIKKAGRSLCTLYPAEGFFSALAVIGERERARAETELPLFSPGFQALYRETKAGMGQKWLLFEVKDSFALEDLKHCMAIRRGIPWPI